MANNRIYLALGEEAARGVKESSAVGFVPLLSPGIPKLEFNDRPKKEFRGSEAALGASAYERMSQRWGATLEIPFYTESGGAVKGASGTLLKHFFGGSSTVQNGSTGEYSHMLYPTADPFSEAHLGERAVTLNLNINEGALMRNWPYVGGRVRALSFEQEAGSALKLTAELAGQRRDEAASELGGVEYASEALRCDYRNLRIYTGAVTRAGSAPGFADFSFGGALAIRPEKVSIKAENGMEDALRLSGADYPDRTRMGQFKVSVEMTIDWEDPESGFSSVAEFRAWAAGASLTNLFFHWDTGTQAGTGANHGLFIDLPRLRRTGGEPEYRLERDPVAVLKYEGLLDPATGYMMGLLLRNTAESI